MRIYSKPEMAIKKFSLEEIATASGEQPNGIEYVGSQAAGDKPILKDTVSYTTLMSE